MDKVILTEKFSAFDSHWDPKIVADLNGQQVKVAKLLGEFVWHSHANEDELFWVVKGNLRMEFRDRSVEIGPGELLVVPRGVEHRPVAEQEVQVVLFEPASTVNTGEEQKSERTVTDLERI